MSAIDQTLPEGTDHVIEGAGVSETDDVRDHEADVQIGEDVMGKPNENAKSGSSRSDAADTNSKAPGEGGTSSTLFASIDAWRTEGVDRAREYAQAGVDRTTEALDEVVRMVNDAADQIDGKLGSQYGGYARRAAEGIGGFGDVLKNKDVDQLFEDAREIVRKSPAVALGAAAALGFVVARLARAGAEAAESAAKSTGAKG